MTESFGSHGDDDDETYTGSDIAELESENDHPEGENVALLQDGTDVLQLRSAMRQIQRGAN